LEQGLRLCVRWCVFWYDLISCIYQVRR
jgi:hypothetical protein